jgi:uncharacterized membrane protein AbrB (regulator of aidB expression)
MKRRIIQILLIIIALIIIATCVAYFIYKPEKPWLAFFIACCGGAFVFNLVIAIFFINKNFKDKR